MLRRLRKPDCYREYKQRSAKIDLAGVDTRAKIFVGLTGGAEVGKVSAEQQGQSENLRARFAPGVQGIGIAFMCLRTLLCSTALAAYRIAQSKLLD